MKNEKKNELNLHSWQPTFTGEIGSKIIKKMTETFCF